MTFNIENTNKKIMYIKVYFRISNIKYNTYLNNRNTNTNKTKKKSSLFT